ncbi:hypothetical protein ACIREE_07605 [Streptomyces sp. NPDC102467]|uniref:hypothetical protein n=1 Tax=Streptomyces sp. NPDC102467 TaxID=3366179 RepID=UPI00382B5F14
MPLRSGWLSPDGQSREDTRLAPLGTLTPTSPLATRSGVLPGSTDGKWRISGFTVTGTPGAMTASVSPGRAVIQGTETQGAYPVALDDYLPLTFADGDAQYDRVDLVVLRILDDTYDASGRAEAAVEIIPGTPAATPAIPATPALAMPLYQVSVAKGTSAGSGGLAWDTVLVGLRNATVALGGILPVTSDTTNGAYPGQYRDAGSTLQRWNGSAWADYQPPQPAAETTTAGASATGNWTLAGYRARRVGGVCSFTLTLTRTTNNLTATAAGTTNPGNVGDETIGSLPVGWRPAFDIYAIASDGYANGCVRVDSDGSLTLLSWSTSGVIQVGNSVRVSACFVL